MEHFKKEFCICFQGISVLPHPVSLKICPTCGRNVKKAKRFH